MTGYVRWSGQLTFSSFLNATLQAASTFLSYSVLIGVDITELGNILTIQATNRRRRNRANMLTSMIVSWQLKTHSFYRPPHQTNLIMGAEDETLDVENSVSKSRNREQSTDAKKQRNGYGRRYRANVTHMWAIQEGSQTMAKTGTPLWTTARKEIKIWKQHLSVVHTHSTHMLSNC